MKSVLIIVLVLLSTPAFSQYEKTKIDCKIWNTIPEAVKVIIAGKTAIIQPNKTIDLQLPAGQYLVQNEIVVNGKVDSSWEYTWTISPSTNNLTAYRTTLYKELKKLFKPIF